MATLDLGLSFPIGLLPGNFLGQDRRVQERLRSSVGGEGNHYTALLARTCIPEATAEERTFCTSSGYGFDDQVALWC